ncbi:MAG TPA: cation-transporting P-type ATPase, partial [Leptolyngbyaceae cyanobacterium M65_K2018_010]|nr:cation-transporting P-type ATPase [Leptolyngbyaceae cyanobacterium M65_K2018_010]
RQGLRVLGVAYGTPPPEPLAFTSPLIWLGLVGMADPIRSGVKEAIATFHRAGIATVMVTGDQSPTAHTIGQALNLSQGKALKMLDGSDLSHLTPEQAGELCQQVHIFSRISPAHKLQVVQALQRAGQVVAMTGDGINDTPALKAAEVGIAMGHSGTDAAREVADVILQDDDLGTMVQAVSQGRTIYGNIRKAVHFLLATNLSEIMVMFAAISLGLGQPLNALQLLWLNLVTDIFPGLALALEPAEPGVLTQPPRPPEEPIIQPAAFQRMVLESTVLSVSALGAYGFALHRYGMGPQASTLGFMSLTLAQLLHALSCRSRARCVFGPQRLPANRYLALALSLSLTLQFGALGIPPLGHLLRLTPLSWLDAAVITASALIPLVINEATKATPPTPAEPDQPAARIP